MKTNTWHGPDSWSLVGDRTEVFPDDPGQGAPLMVYAPKAAASGTLTRVLDTEELDTSTGKLLPVPPRVIAWLETVAEAAETWTYQ